MEEGESFLVGGIDSVFDLVECAFDGLELPPLEL